MEDRILLALDLSTTCTGWALFNINTKALITYGTLKPTTKGGIAKLTYPRQQLTKMIDLSLQIKNLLDQYKPSQIVIEEIAGSKNRLGQKVLDGLHWIVLMHIPDYVDVISYYDVTGAEGWRTNLGLKLTEADKAANKEAKKLNPKLGKGNTKLPIYDAKDLAARHVNKKYGLALDPQTSQSDTDIADAISIGDAYLTFRCSK